VRQDCLDTLVRSLTSEFKAATSWEEFVTSFRGKSYLSPNLEHLDHPAGPLLCNWRDHGVPAQTSSEPWPVTTRDAYVERGCHHSAVMHATFLREEMAEFIDNRFWVVLPYRVVRDLPQLQLSPAVKEERQRKPRLLCDHSWYPVNECTLPHAPPKAMQFGGALHLVLHNVRHANPKFGPVHLSKYDINDGFYPHVPEAKRLPQTSRHPAPLRRRRAAGRHPHVLHNGMGTVPSHLLLHVRAPCPRLSRTSLMLTCTKARGRLPHCWQYGCY
jgi:hypothetical protein